MMVETRALLAEFEITFPLVSRTTIVNDATLKFANYQPSNDLHMLDISIPQWKKYSRGDQGLLLRGENSV